MPSPLTSHALFLTNFTASTLPNPQHPKTAIPSPLRQSPPVVPLTVHCPAKVNLFLAVGKLDAHGYHPIRTIFQAIGIFDILTISRAEQDEIVCDWPELPPENTLTKALRLVRELCPVPPLQIHLEKQIPAESGLGGGSSDAAGLLRAVQRITSVPEAFLMDVAAAVGKDVPFFLVGGRAKAEGYGERLTSLSDAEKEWFVVVRPESVSCNTKEAYARLDQMEYPFHNFPEGDEVYNDFERVAPCESLDYIETLLSYGARDALLCGSGSAVFGRFAEEVEARQAVRRLNEDYRARVYLAPSLAREESLGMDFPAKTLE